MHTLKQLYAGRVICLFLADIYSPPVENMVALWLAERCADDDEVESLLYEQWKRTLRDNPTRQADENEN